MAVPYLGTMSNQILSISFVTLGELLAGAGERGWGARRRDALIVFMDQFFVLESNRAVAEAYAFIRNDLRARGRWSSDNDAWIAATALAYQLPLVTHNRRHFEHIPGLELVSFAP